MPNELSFDLASLAQAYKTGTLRASEVIEETYRRIGQDSRKGVWIYLRPKTEALAEAAALEARDTSDLPLYGLPFAVKDNIDVASVPTTAACPEFSYLPEANAPCVEKLREAGAIFIGKTNLDQFATGLVGVRSTYGACENSFDPNYISGGSSSGSAVAVALGLVSFSLGTDTAGSGRIPAACNNLVGLKPTRGLVSTRGVVPACRSLDCVSIFALTVEDASLVRGIIEGFDEDDPYSRQATQPLKRSFLPKFRFGIPHPLELYGDEDAGKLYADAVSTLHLLGGESVEIDFVPFQKAASLLYDGPWVAERWETLREFHAKHADAFHPVTRKIIERGSNFTAAELFTGLHELEELRRAAEAQWSLMDFLLVPTAASIFTIAEVEANPIELNSQLGHYTNFTNLLDCSAIAVPGGLRDNGLPFGVTLIARAFEDQLIGEVASKFHRAIGGNLGATGIALSSLACPEGKPADSARTVALAVVGAHLSGEPLNHQLTDRGATLLRACRTAASYALYALPATVPAKPGLLCVGTDGAAIEVEVWSVPDTAFGSLVAAVPKPLTIGTVTLETGESVKGFLCESHALDGAEDITAFGGWRNYRTARTT